MYNFADEITIICVEKTEFTLLNKIQYPEDLRKLTVDELPQLCDELRRDIVEDEDGGEGGVRGVESRLAYGLGE